jgi:hypothetical protein
MDFFCKKEGDENLAIAYDNSVKLFDSGIYVVYF